MFCRTIVARYKPSVFQDDVSGLYFGRYVFEGVSYDCYDLDGTITIEESEKKLNKYLISFDRDRHYGGEVYYDYDDDYDYAYDDDF